MASSSSTTRKIFTDADISFSMLALDNITSFLDSFPVIKDQKEVIAYLQKNYLSQRSNSSANTNIQTRLALVHCAIFHFSINCPQEGLALLDLINTIPPPPSYLQGLQAAANPNIKWTYDVNSLNKNIGLAAQALSAFSIPSSIINQFRRAAQPPHSLLSLFNELKKLSHSLSLTDINTCIYYCMKIFYVNSNESRLTPVKIENSSSTIPPINPQEHLTPAKAEQKHAEKSRFAVARSLSIQKLRHNSLSSSFQDIIDAYLQFDHPQLEDPVIALFYMANFITQLGSQELGNMLSQQIITVFQEYGHTCEPPGTQQSISHQRSPAEFKKLLKDVLDEQIPNIKKSVHSMFLPNNMDERTNFYIYFFIQGFFIGKKGSEKLFETIPLPRAQVAQLILALMAVSNNLNSKEFINFIKNIAEKHYPHVTPELNKMLDAYQRNPIVNTEKLEELKEMVQRAMKKYSEEGIGYIDKISQAMLNNTENPYHLAPVINTICQLLPQNGLVSTVTASLLEIYLRLLYQSRSALKYPFTSKKEVDACLDKIMLKAKSHDCIQELSDFLKRLGRLPESEALLKLNPFPSNVIVYENTQAFRDTLKNIDLLIKTPKKKNPVHIKPIVSLSWHFDPDFLHEEFKKYIKIIKEEKKASSEDITTITNALKETETPPHNIQPLIDALHMLINNNYKNEYQFASDCLSVCLNSLYRSRPQKMNEEKKEIIMTPKENKLEKMETLSLQEYSDLTNDQLNVITSQDHYSYHVRNMYAAAIECKDILPFNSIQFGLFKNKEWQNSIDQPLQVIYQTPLTDSSSVLFMLAHFLVGVGKIQKAVWLLQFLQSQTASVVVKSKLDELQAKTKSISLELPKSQATSAALNPKKLESSITILKKTLEHNPDILEKVLPLFQKPPKPTQFLDLLINILKNSHPAIIALVLREYCFGYSHANAIRATALPVPLLEGPGPRTKPAKKAKTPVNEEEKRQLAKQNISSPVPHPVAAPSIPTPDTSSTPKKETYSVIRSKTRNTPKKIRTSRQDKKKDNVVEEKANTSVQPSTNLQSTDSTATINQIFKTTSDGCKPKESKLNTSTSSSSHETKKMSSSRVSLNKSSHLESSLSDFLPYVSPLTIPKIQAFLDNVQKIGATVYVYGSAHDYWLLDKTKNKPTFIPNDFDLKINCKNLSPDQMQRIFVEIKLLIPEIMQQKTDKHYDFIEGRMDEDYICNITFEKADYIKTQDPIIISDCQSQITSAGVKCDLNAYPELKRNLKQKIFSIRPLTASSTTDELPAQSVLMRIVKKVHSTCQLSELKPDDNVSHFFSFEGALQFFNTIQSKIHLELSKLFDWVGKQIASRRKTSDDFSKEGIGGLLPFMQAYLTVKNHRNDIDAATELLQNILATENPEKLFKYNSDSRNFPINQLIVPQKNYNSTTQLLSSSGSLINPSSQPQANNFNLQNLGIF